LGVRGITLLVPFAGTDLSSAASTLELTSTLLPLHLQTLDDSGAAAAMSAWKRLPSSLNTASISSAPSPPSSHWDDQCCKVQSDSLLVTATDHVVRARLLAACSSRSRTWLETFLLSCVGQKGMRRQ